MATSSEVFIAASAGRLTVTLTLFSVLATRSRYGRHWKACGYGHLTLGGLVSSRSPPRPQSKSAEERQENGLVLAIGGNGKGSDFGGFRESCGG